MKKILSFIVLLAGMAVFTSCSDSDNNSDSTGFAITKADIMFGAGGGDGSIVANTAIASATTNASWLTLATNGNTVTVTAKSNGSLEGRSAKIVIQSADGASASVSATQYGMLLLLDAKSSYMFDDASKDPVFIADKSNVDFDLAVSDDWIHIEKADNGYSVSVDPNTGAYRHGTVTFSYATAEFSQVVNIGQWGTSLPFDQLTTATYTDESGAEHTKTISIVADASKENAYLVKGLLAEGDIQLLYNANNTATKEWYISSGYQVGTLTEEGTTYNLRCMMSAANVNTGNRYVPTTATTSATSGYRMAFNWENDGTGDIGLNYVRNSNLSASYSTDGFIVCKYTGTSVSAGSRKGIVYYFLNIKFTK